MRTRYGLLVLLGAMALAPVAAMAQTTSSTTGATTSSSSTSTSSTSSTSTSTSTSTTSTIVVVDPRCAFTGGCTQNEPTAVLAASSGEQAGVYGGACWQLPPGSNPPGLTRCASVLIADPFPRSALLVRPGESLEVRFDPPLVPDEVTVTRSTGVHTPGLQTLSATPTSPTRFGAAFPEGTFILDVQVRFAQGVVPYFFAVRVQATAPATESPVSFTG